MSSETNVVTSTLRTLHRIHQQLSDLKERQERGPRVARAQQANIERLTAQLAETETQAKTLRIGVDKKQLQLDSGEGNVQKRRLQLQQADNNREYQALKEQIAADEMANSVLADEILEALERADQANQQVTEAKAAVEKAKQDAQRLAHEFQQQEPVIQGDLERLQGERRLAEEELPSEFRVLYDRLVKARGEDALAVVDGDFCTGCNQQIPLNMISALMLSNPILCKSCGRMLYLPENFAAR